MSGLGLGKSEAPGELAAEAVSQESQAALAAAARDLTDAELSERIAAIRGNPKRNGKRRLTMAETLALATLLEETHRRTLAASSSGGATT